MKKHFLIALLIFVIALAAFPAVASEENVTYTYVAARDTFIDPAQKEKNFGKEIYATAQSFLEQGMSYVYVGFDFNGEGNDDPLVVDPPNPNLGFWYEADLTKRINEIYFSKDKSIDIQIVSEYLANATVGARYYTRESQFNLPHMVIKLNSAKTRVLSAKFYIFGGCSAPSIIINELDESFDEETVTYNKRPYVGEKIGTGKKNDEMSGTRETETSRATVGSYTIESGSTKTMAAFEAQFPDYTKWDEIYDITDVPTTEEVLADFAEKCPNGEHPRILGTKEDWERTRRWYSEGDELVTKWAEQIIAAADSGMDVEIPDDFTLNANGTDMLYRGGSIVNFAKAYQLTLDKKYADHAYELMAKMAGYSHWNAGGKDLNVGDCAKNVGISFDLVYDALTEEQRDTVATGILKHAVAAKLNKPNLNLNNWNPVTNGGLGIGAMAIMNEYPNEAAQMVVQCVSAIPHSLMEYYPDGSFPEGVAYWSYMSENFIDFLAALRSGLGKSYKLEEFTGFSKTGYYPLYLQGPTKDIRFKFGDDSAKVIGLPEMFYLAELFDNPHYAQYQFEIIRANKAYITLAPYWYTEEMRERAQGMYDELPLDRCFDGHAPVATMRSAWEDENALFIGTKGGFPQISHSDMDMGTFTLAALGQEWGIEFYPLVGSRAGFPSQFRMTRYMYYGASPQGHNTLFFDPGATYPNLEFGQELTTHTRFEDFYSGDNSAYSIMDLSDAYRRYSSSLKRGIALFNNRREFLIQDELVSGARNTLYWFMHTKADITTNGNTAVLSIGENRLYCKILSPVDATFEVLPAAALPNTPTIADFDDTAYPTIKKLSIKMPVKGSEKVAVWMVPLTAADPIPEEEPELIDLAQWPMPEKEVATVDGITVNGTPLSGFAPKKFVYDMEIDEDQFNVQVTGAPDDVTYALEEIPSGVKITCKSDSGKKSSRYVIRYVRTQDISHILVEASDVPQPANSPENTLDGDLNTRWASTDEQWIRYDLGKAQLLDSVSVAFYSGSSRMYNFNIEVSEDGETYTKVFDGRSNGISDDFTKYSFEKRMVRYVRINCNRNNENEWNNISDVRFGYVLN